MPTNQSMERFRQLLYADDKLGLRLDISRIQFGDSFFQEMAVPLGRAFGDMEALERGAIANPDEGRMVGHYWLRAPELAPTDGIRRQIEETQRDIDEFAARICNEQRFTDLLVIGIGGSALGPQLVADALGCGKQDALRPHFIDNTDPDGMARVVENIGDALPATLCVVISKSGGTPENRNGMVVMEKVFADAGLPFTDHAVAITGEDSRLDRHAEENGWLARFPMWDWVGGRTSVTSAVGLLPAALQGIDTKAFLAGAAACDRATRVYHATSNPAALLAAAWWAATNGRGERDMVVLPYRDRLQLFSRYLQQLVMESLGKELDLDGKRVEQGIAVYGNKGSTDQHAYVQQLRDGVENFFVTFIEVMEDGGQPIPVEGEHTAGDFLHAFLLGTREALSEKGRQSLMVSLRRMDPYHLGVLIALFERAVGFYASLVHVNAYHQPGVEAGKRAAASVLELKQRVVDHLRASEQPQSVADVVAALDPPGDMETVFHLLERLSVNSSRVETVGEDLFSRRYLWHR